MTFDSSPSEVLLEIVMPLLSCHSLMSAFGQGGISPAGSVFLFEKINVFSRRSVSLKLQIYTVFAVLHTAPAAQHSVYCFMWN